MKKVIIFDTPLSIEKKIGRLYTWQDVPRFWEFQLSRNRRVVLGTGNGFLAKFQVTMLGNLPAIRNYSRLDIHQAEMYLLLYKLSPAESYKYLRRLGRHKRNNNTTKKRRRKKTKKKWLRIPISSAVHPSLGGRDEEWWWSKTQTDGETDPHGEEAPEWRKRR